MQNSYYHCNRRKYNLKAHIVLVTKYRKKLLIDDIKNTLKQECFRLADIYGWHIIAMETDIDHIHILLGQI